MREERIIRVCRFTSKKEILDLLSGNIIINTKIQEVNDVTIIGFLFWKIDKEDKIKEMLEKQDEEFCMMIDIEESVLKKYTNDLYSSISYTLRKARIIKIWEKESLKLIDINEIKEDK